MRFLRLSAALFLGLLVPVADAASLTELLAAVPAPPRDAASALTWVADGRIVNPEFLAIGEALAAARAAQPVHDTGAAPGQDGSPAALRVEQGYDSYVAAHSGDKAPETALGKRKRWLQKAMGGQQLRINAALRACAEPCADAAVLAHNAQQLERRARTLTTELEAWGALFADWRAQRAPVVRDAETRIAAAPGSAAAAAYRAAMLDEIVLLYSITELAVLRALAIDRGLDGSEPDSISGATRKTVQAR